MDREKKKQTNRSSRTPLSLHILRVSTGCITLITFLHQHRQDCAMSLAIGMIKSSAQFHHIESGLTERDPKANCLPPHLWCSRQREDKWKSSLGTAAPQRNKCIFIKKERCRIRTSPFSDGLNTPRIFSVASKTTIRLQNPHNFPSANRFYNPTDNLHVLWIPFLRVECCHISGDWCQPCSRPWSHRSADNRWR